MRMSGGKPGDAGPGHSNADPARRGSQERFSSAKQPGTKITVVSAMGNVVRCLKAGVVLAPYSPVGRAVMERNLPPSHDLKVPEGPRGLSVQNPAEAQPEASPALARAEVALPDRPDGPGTAPTFENRVPKGSLTSRVFHYVQDMNPFTGVPGIFAEFGGGDQSAGADQILKLGPKKSNPMPDSGVDNDIPIVPGWKLSQNDTRILQTPHLELTLPELLRKRQMQALGYQYDRKPAAVMPTLPRADMPRTIDQDHRAARMAKHVWGPREVEQYRDAGRFERAFMTVGGAFALATFNLAERAIVGREKRAEAMNTGLLRTVGHFERRAVASFGKASAAAVALHVVDPALAHVTTDPVFWPLFSSMEEAFRNVVQGFTGAYPGEILTAWETGEKADVLLRQYFGWTGIEPRVGDFVSDFDFNNVRVFDTSDLAVDLYPSSIDSRSPGEFWTSLFSRMNGRYR